MIIGFFIGFIILNALVSYYIVNMLIERSLIYLKGNVRQLTYQQKPNKTLEIEYDFSNSNRWDFRKKYYSFKVDEVKSINGTIYCERPCVSEYTLYTGSPRLRSYSDLLEIINRSSIYTSDGYIEFKNQHFLVSINDVHKIIWKNDASSPCIIKENNNE